MRLATSVTITMLLALSISAFGQIVDPVGFCPTTTVPTQQNAVCSTGTGLAGETIAIGANGFYMFKNGQGGTAADPWYLLVAIPNYSGVAPSITGPFTQNFITDFGHFLPTTNVDLYAFAGLSGDSSMNAANMFGANEVAAFGSTPNFFQVFGYNYTPGIVDETAYLFSVGGTGLAAGTFLAAAGGTNPFTTPFTVTGLVNSTGGGGGGGGGGGNVPEPVSILLMGTVGLLVTGIAKRKFRLS